MVIKVHQDRGMSSVLAVVPDNMLGVFQLPPLDLALDMLLVLALVLDNMLGVFELPCLGLALDKLGE